MEKIQQYTIKHSLDLRVSVEKDKIKKKLRKSRASKTNSNDDQQQENKILPQKVFLYLHPKSITYPIDDIPTGRAEIEVEHRISTITTLSDHFMPRNVIQIDKFEIEKPTFSITIEQDNLEDITALSDSPVILTLYVHTQKAKSIEKSTEKLSSEEEEYVLEDVCIPIAQGHIDILEYFSKKRSHSFETIYLYPLKAYGQILTCKTEWEIYSLHPLLKNITFTNILFITLGSLYNIENEIMDKSEDLIAKLSLISKNLNENNEYIKIFICKFTAFSKSIISKQNLCKKWESLKNKEFDNIESMGIAAIPKINLNQLFTNLLCNENVNLNTENINITEDLALVCNSIHRYILTDTVQMTLENILCSNEYQIIVEIYSEKEEEKILLQGFMDLSVFIYPEVKSCSFGIALRPPGYKQNISLTTAKNGKLKRKSKNLPNTQQQINTNEKIPFVIIQICVHKPITNPPQDMLDIFQNKKTHHKYAHCITTLMPKVLSISLQRKCEQRYRDFDDLIREMLDYIIRTKITTINDDKEYFCLQLRNITNKIIKLIACDFNLKIPTKNNIEFVNLLTSVYRDLVSRIRVLINMCSIKDLETCVLNNIKVQQFVATNISTIKFLNEVRNFEMSNFILNELQEGYPNNLSMDFYIFVYDIEKQSFEMAKRYLDKSLDNKDIQGEMFGDIVKIYINYNQQLQNVEQNEYADEDLITALTNYNLNHCPKSLTVWILLYCLYKKYNYQPGITYCRWMYENESLDVKLGVRPQSIWEIYMPYKIHLNSSKGQKFITVFEQLVYLGLYNFAEWIFEEISVECLDIEKYFVTSTFLILSNKVKDNFRTRTFSVDKFSNALEMRATLSLVNGNLEYSRNSLEYIKHYEDIVKLEELEDYKPYQLGLFRYAYKMMVEKNYVIANRVFSYCCDENLHCFVPFYERGKACYHLGQLQEAEKYFALTTKSNIYMPNAWAYLALVNLKMGNTYNALECWKYAKLNPDAEIHEDILKELNQINYNKVFLYVDKPLENIQ